MRCSDHVAATKNPTLLKEDKMGALWKPARTSNIPIWQRRALVLALNIGTTAFLLWLVYISLEPGGIKALEAFILACTALCIPWPIVTFWNAIISLCILAFGDAEQSIYPYFDAKGPPPEISSKTALVICMRNEDPKPLFDRLYAMQESLRCTGQLRHFRFVLLSDTSQPSIAEAEEKGFAQIRNDIARGMSGPPVYRRRRLNTGYKAGNIEDYLHRLSAGDELFVTLDQDSAMGGDLLVRMVSSMEKHPKIGLLQTLCIGMPAVSAFARLFQFGIRHSVRAYSLGNSWWTDDCALYWGHNAIIRTKPFLQHCLLPKLPGKPPLGGHILSHDLMEAMFMRRAGYETRLIPIETQSYETQPPTLLDYLRRELRWCQGTMQYWFLITEPGLHPLSRFQVYQTLATYLTQAISVVLAIASIANMLLDGHVGTKATVLSMVPQLIIVIVSSGCKIAGILDVTLNSSKKYGGMLHWASGALVEAVLMLPLTAITAVAVAHFLVTLFAGKTISWDGQNRDQLGLSWRAAARALWLHTLLGVCSLGALAASQQYTMSASWAWIWAVCLIAAVPYAVFTASPCFALYATRSRMFMIPEEVRLPALLSTLVAKEIKPVVQGTMDAADLATEMYRSK